MAGYRHDSSASGRAREVNVFASRHAGPLTHQSYRIPRRSTVGYAWIWRPAFGKPSLLPAHLIERLAEAPSDRRGLGDRPLASPGDKPHTLSKGSPKHPRTRIHAAPVLTEQAGGMLHHGGRRFDGMHEYLRN